MTQITKFYDLSAIDKSNLADSTKHQYKKALYNYLDSGGEIHDANSLTAYAETLPNSSRSFLKSAVRLLTKQIELDAKSRATPENIGQVQAVVFRIEALNSAVSVKQNKGTRANIWLSHKQVEDLMATCGKDITGTRDWIVLGTILGAGLRREEFTTMTFDEIKRQPMRNGQMRTVLQVTGKGAKDRVVPINQSLADKLGLWNAIAGDGFLGRSLGMAKTVGTSLSEIGVFKIVAKHGALIGVPELAPHDLRRTFAQLGYESGVPITQISVLLGHADVATTQRYLNLEIDLETTASDFIPL